MRRCFQPVLRGDFYMNYGLWKGEVEAIPH